MADLVVNCATEPADRMTVGTVHDLVSFQQRVEVGTGTQRATIHLDKEDARKLFNWLGVWLHAQ